MKKPKYLGSHELLIAINDLNERFKNASSFDDLLPCEVDASYKNIEFGQVPTKILIDKYLNRYNPNKCYRIEIDIKLPKFSVERILKIADEDEVRAWLSNLSTENNANTFLYDIYKELSDL